MFDRLCYCCDRLAARAASLAKSQAPSSAAAVHTYIRQEETLVDPAVYEKEEHKFDFDVRDSRFPKTVAVPEGAHFTFHFLRPWSSFAACDDAIDVTRGA